MASERTESLNMEAALSTMLSWPWPWPKALHEYHPHLNLSTVEYLWDDMAFTRQFMYNPINETSPVFGWGKVWLLNATQLEEHYLTHHAESGDLMTLCDVFLFQKGPPIESFVECFNFTLNDLKLFVKYSLSESYQHGKPAVDYYIGFVVISFVLGLLGMTFIQ